MKVWILGFTTDQGDVREVTAYDSLDLAAQALLQLVEKDLQSICEAFHLDPASHLLEELRKELGSYIERPDQRVPWFYFDVGANDIAPWSWLRDSIDDRHWRLDCITIQTKEDK